MGLIKNIKTGLALHKAIKEIQTKPLADEIVDAVQNLIVAIQKVVELVPEAKEHVEHIVEILKGFKK